MLRSGSFSSPPYAAIAVVSAAGLAYEVLLIRLFSIVQWHHFAHMVISLALLGFGASGAFLSLFASGLRARFALAFAANAILFGVTAVASFWLVQALPFNPLELLWDPWQPGWLFLTYVLLAVPFFFAANCLGLSFYTFFDRIPRAYAYDLVGAGIGSLSVVVLLYVLDPRQLLALVGAVGVVAAALVIIPAAGAKRWAGAAGVTLVLVPAALGIGRALPLETSPYKSLPQALNVEGASLVEQMSSPLGLLSVVRSPAVPFRHVPGLSLNSTVEPPPQLAVFADADAMSVVTRFDGDLSKMAYLDYVTSAAPYHLLREPRVLILGAGGGADVLQALYFQATAIDAVEVNPQMVKLVDEAYGKFAGQLYDRDEVSVHKEEARGFVASAGGPYDLIQVALLDSFNASSAGLYALSESYLYTVEAIQEYLRPLAPDGILAITRWVKLPPRDGLRLFATVLAALRASGIEDPERRLAWIRSWNTSTLLVKNGILTAEDIAAVRQFSESRAFDTAYFPGIRAEEANRYNVLSAPVFSQGAKALLGPSAQAFLESYKFDIRPATDDRPYFFNFFRWTSLPELLAVRHQGGMALLDSGYLILVLTLIQAALASLLLILLPAWIQSRRQASFAPWSIRWGVLGYFMAIGLAFLFVEIAFIQKFILFLSHPVYAVAVVLAGFLVFAGLGSRHAQERGGRLGWGKPLWPAVGGITLIAAVYVFLLPLAFDAWMSWHIYLKILVSLVLIAPLAFLMGFPFPLALAALGQRHRELIPWAWAINGCASVLAAVLATLLAIHFGFTVVVLSAVVLYGLAAWIGWRSFAVGTEPG